MRRWMLLFFAACGAPESQDFTGAPCPCAEDQICCTLTQICAPEPSQCPDPVRLEAIAPSSGAPSGGYVVEISGTGLGLVSEVRFDEKPCRELELSEARRLRCRMPSGAPWGETATLRLVGEDEEVLAVREDAFRYVGPAFVDRAEAWGFRRATFGGGVSLLRPGIDGRPWIFYGALSEIDVGFPDLRAPVEPDAWRWDGEAYVRVPFGETDESSSMIVTDFDNDGRAEALTARGEGAIVRPDLAPSLYQLDSPEDIIQTESGISSSEHLLPIDVDGDNDIDLVGCRFFNAAPFALFRNQASQGASTFVREGLSVESFGCSTLQAGDLDGDLRPEIFLRSDGGQIFSLRDGKLVRSTDEWALNADLNRSNLAIGAASFVDVDLDGDQDLVAIGEGEVDLSVDRPEIPRQSGMLLFLNQRVEDGRSRFELAGRLDLPGPELFECAIDFSALVDGSLRWGLGTAVWFDADMDGDIDAFVPAFSGRCIMGPGLYINRIDEGRVGFTMHGIETDWSYTAPIGGAAGDIDGDGDLDVLFNNARFGTRALFENQLAQRAGGTFRALVVRPVSDPDGDATDADQSDDRLEPSVVVQLDVDGDDFEADASLRSQTTGAMRGYMSNGLFEAHFGLGAHEGPVWVRTRFPDGSIVTARVPAGQQIIELRDCPADDCPP